MFTENLTLQAFTLNKKIILYAPTWKGTLYNNLDYNVEDFKKTVAKLSENIDTEHYRIYLRVHYFLYKILANDPELRPMLIPFTIDTNDYYLLLMF